MNQVLIDLPLVQQIGINRTNPIGMTTKAGRGGGTYTHVDIAIHFANWLNVKFYTHLIQEFRRLKSDESNLVLKQWDLRRELSKASYQIQTDAIREHLSPVLDWNTDREIPLFASEADLLNQAVFGMTAKEFKLYKPDFKGNLRDFATTEQLEVGQRIATFKCWFNRTRINARRTFSIIESSSEKELKCFGI